jgi:hemerythrin superfamily protein
MSQQKTRDDVVEVVLAQHREVERLFSKLENAPSGSAEGAFCDLRRMVAVHETAEEEVVYPALRGIGDDGLRLAQQRIAEERKAKQVLADLERIDPGSADFWSRLASFKAMVTEHAESEEREVLPLLREHVRTDRLEVMANVFKVAEAAAPTHPHPHAPDGAVGSLAFGPALAIMDKVRDAIHANRGNS